MITVKQGDTHDTVWIVNMDLTGCSARLLAHPKPKSGLPDLAIELPCAITNAAAGEITHTLSGTLAVADYNVEAEITRAGEIVTFPNCGYETLRVVDDLD